jgi:hypothetical protein
MSGAAVNRTALSCTGYPRTSCRLTRRRTEMTPGRVLRSRHNRATLPIRKSPRWTHRGAYNCLWAGMVCRRPCREPSRTKFERSPHLERVFEDTFCVGPERRLLRERTGHAGTCGQQHHGCKNGQISRCNSPMSPLLAAQHSRGPVSGPYSCKKHHTRGEPV